MPRQEERSNSGSSTDIEDTREQFVEIEKDVSSHVEMGPAITKESQSDRENKYTKPRRPGGKIELEENDVYEKLGFAYPEWKKWMILSVIFVVQVSMNFNASVYANAVTGISSQFNVSSPAARVGQCVFLIAYAFGCELWAPWSEEIGRWPILQLSLFLVNIWQIPAALAPNYVTVVVARFLGGVSSAGGSVTLGLIADMWDDKTQDFAVAFIVLSSVGGSVVGPVVGGFIEQNLDWRWNFWIQLIFGVFTQALHFFLVPETAKDVLIGREAKKMRKAGRTDVYGPLELDAGRFAPRKIIKIWVRPFWMLATEPIVLCLSLLSGFSDALIFTFLDSYTPVFKQWNFSTIELGLAFLPLLIGYFIAYFSFFPFFYRHRKITADKGGIVPERRLYWLLWLAPLEIIGLFGFAWTSLGPSNGIHWIAPLIFSTLVGIANYAIYMATIDYMIAAYGKYAASATGGNGFSRDFLAGVAAMYATPFYEYFPHNTLEIPTTILACISLVITIPIYVFYFKGEWFRKKSKFAQELCDTRQNNGEGSRKSDAETEKTPNLAQQA